MSLFLWCFLLWFIALNVWAIIVWLICTITTKRFHFIEISDMHWCPQLFRQCVRNSLHYGWIAFGLSDYFGSPASTLSKIMLPHFKKLHIQLIIDLCSGSGGPTPYIHNILNKTLKTKPIKAILTDLWPQITLWKYQCSKSKHLLYSTKSVNAASINVSNIHEISNLYHDEIHFRTLFGSFHHFKPDLAISILQNAMECNDAFIMSEAKLRRKTFFDFVQWPLALTVLSIFFIPYMAMGYLFFYKEQDGTFIQRIYKCFMIVITSPLWVAVFIHDGIISNARVYTEKELIDLTEMAKIKAKRKLENNDTIDKDKWKKIDNYEWKAWRQNSDMMFPLGYVTPITVLLGVPKL